MTRALALSKIAVFLSLAVLAGVLAWQAVRAGAEWSLVARDTRQVLGKLDGVVAEADRAAKAFAGYSETQLKILQSEKNQKALEAGYQAGAALKGTALLLNKQVLPRAMRLLDGLADDAQALGELIRSTNGQLNTGLLPEATGTIQELRAAATAGQQAILASQDGLVAATEDIHAILSDPAIPAALEAIQRASEGAAGTTKQVELAAQKLPEIAQSLKEIAATSSRYRKAILLSQILSALGRAFF